MGLIFILVAQAGAEEAPVLAEKISGLFSGQSCQALMGSVQPKSVQVFYLRGSPVDAINAPQAGEKLLQIVSLVGEARGHAVSGEGLHHTSWRSVCKSIKEANADRVYLVGHSYGASGSVKIAHCLKEAGKSVNLLATISSYDFLAGVDVTKIPDNVGRHFNYWTSDPSMPGYKNHQADDPAKTFVQNIFAPHDSSFPHLKVAEDIVSLIALQILANLEGMDARVSVPEEINGNLVDNELSKYWRCADVLGRAQREQAE